MIEHNLVLFYHSKMSIIHTSGLCKTYRGGVIRKTSVQALKDFSLDVEPGEIFGLLGPNGAGKTTFVKLLLSIVFPTSGNGELFGKPLGNANARSYCGYLPENHRYPSFLTAYETLAFFGQLSGMANRILKDRIHAQLEFVGLKEWKDQKVQKFSKGMLQRLGLAQALLNEPQILFLDEPTDGVDPVGRKEFRDLFLKLRKDGITVFLNSHLLSEVELISDRVAILNKGSLVKVGTIDEIRGKESGHQIQIVGVLSVEQQQMARLHAELTTSDNGITSLFVKTDSDLNRCIDLLRSWGIAIKTVSQQKSTLEDSFLKLISPERFQ